MTTRLLVLPDRGTLLISTDLHGKRDSFERLRERFFELRERADDLHYVLGNHDHGHVGGPHTRKFHDDEVAALEARLTPEQHRRTLALFGEALLAIATPCGLLLSHGSPGEALRELAELDTIALDPMVMEPDPHKREILRSILTDYGQRGEVTARMLASVSRPQLELRLVVHGHDRDESGLFIEGDNQICPVIFGAQPELERCLVVDLAARYRSPADLREGVEIIRIR